MLASVFWPVFGAVTTSTSLHSCNATGSQPVSKVSQSVRQSVSQKPAEMLP